MITGCAKNRAEATVLNQCHGPFILRIGGVPEDGPSLIKKCWHILSVCNQFMRWQYLFDDLLICDKSSRDLGQHKDLEEQYFPGPVDLILTTHSYPSCHADCNPQRLCLLITKCQCLPYMLGVLRKHGMTRVIKSGVLLYFFAYSSTLILFDKVFRCQELYVMQT